MPSERAARLAAGIFLRMRLVLLIAVLWLLFDVALVAMLITARHVYAALRRLRTSRLSRLAGPRVP
jgi:hypothetical protein